jgi:hypothetical protein
MSSNTGWNIPSPPSPTGINVYPATPTPKQVVSRPTGKTLVSTEMMLGMTIKKYASITVYRWYESIFRTTTLPNTSQTYKIEVVTGNSSTQSETQTFGASIGVEAGVSIDGIGAKINATISETSESTQSVTVTDEKTVSYSFAAPDHKEQQSYDVWQLVEQYVVTTTTTMSSKEVQGEVPAGETQGGVLTNRLPQYDVTGYPNDTEARMVPA